MSEEKPLTKEEQQRLKRNLVQIKQVIDQADAVFFPDRPRLIRSAFQLASVKMQARAKALASGKAERPSLNPKVAERFNNFRLFNFDEPEPELTENEKMILQ